MLEVHARVDIVTAGGLLIAERGAGGQAKRDPKPRRVEQVGMSLVTFNGRSRAYWCRPQDLNAQSKPGVWHEYMAKASEHDPFFNAINFPKFAGPKDFDFGHNLCAFRSARKLSQTELAEQMAQHGVVTAQSTISSREQCPESPGGEFVKAAAEVLRVPPFAFFINLGKPHGYRQLTRFLEGVSSSVCEA